MDYTQRRALFLQQTTSREPSGAYDGLARLYSVGDLREEAFSGALERLEARRDCADFQLHAILRLFYQCVPVDDRHAPFLGHCRKTVLGFKYWPDEPGQDSMCTWSENHFILFASGAYLAGARFPAEVFTNSGLTGDEMVQQFRPRVQRWLRLRFQSGFSEWLSNVYYEEDLAALINLADFAPDASIRQQAAMVADLLLLDIVGNQFQGTFGSTHGRSYERHKIDGAHDSTGSVLWLATGLNHRRPGGMGAVTLALATRYRIPRVIATVATDPAPWRETRQRVGIRLAEADQWGLDTGNLEHGMDFLTLEAYCHPRTINLTIRMLDAYGWWDNDFFRPFADSKSLLRWGKRLHALPAMAWFLRRDLTRNLREEADLITVRTPDTMLSTAQDWRPGYGGDQQHIWQATLGERAVCFTTHPATAEGDRDGAGTPNYWTGSGSLPRAAQVGSVVICIYKISTRPGLYITHRQRFTHAWFPKDEFDEVVEGDGWIVARKGEGYLGLWSRNPTSWDGGKPEYAGRELVAAGTRNIWICELGNRRDNGSFEDFAAALRSAHIGTRGLSITYDSPSQGRLHFGWHGKLTQNGKPVSLGPYPRYASNAATAAFPAEKVQVELNGDELLLEWDPLRREATDFLWP